MFPRVLIPVVIFMGMGVFMSISQAEPVNQHYQLCSVSQVLSGQDNTRIAHGYVLLVGRIMARVDDDYIFTDGTGRVKLETGDSRLPIGQVIVVGGRIDHPFMGIGQLGIEVEHWRYFNGTTGGSFTP